MKCLYCNYEAGDAQVCPTCGRDLSVYRKIRQASCICYNRALAKAGTRDLSGAIEDLKQSLSFNKYNIDARNLLGLIYYEVGDAVLAMSEWVISKSFMPYNNIAEEYLDKIKGNSVVLNRIDNATKKYNQVIIYIGQQDYDLAIIQLKRLLSKYPNMVRARSLLALLYMKQNDLALAKKELMYASKIDVGNPTVNTYIKELRILQNAQPEAGGRRKRKNSAEEGTNVSDGESRASYLMDYSKVSIVNIIIGAILGILISVFLILPAIRQRDNDKAMNALITANEDARSTENNISTLREEIETLKSALDNYEGKADVKGSYESLITTRDYLIAGNLEAAANSFANITREILDPQGQKTYGELAESINAYVAQRNYEAARTYKSQEEYASAIPSYLSIIAIDEAYDGGNAMMELAECYELMGDKQSAIDRYSRLAEILPDSRLARTAFAKIEELSN